MIIIIIIIIIINTHIMLLPSAQNGSAASIASSFIEGHRSLDSEVGPLHAGDLLDAADSASRQ